MSDSVTIQQRIQQLKKLQADIPNILSNAAEEATKIAVEATKDATPPKAGTGRGPYIGTNTVTGELKASWDKDSQIKPTDNGDRYTTVLANNKEYASFVNDGHRMDKHFVPGLYVNPNSGLLEYDANADVGIVVGTKTLYVKGEFMVDKGKEAYKKAVRNILDKEIERRMK